MKRSVAIILIVLLCLTLGGTYTAIAGRKIKGTVVDSVSKKPVPFSFVRIENVYTQTDSQGNFERWLPPTPVTPKTLVVLHPCFDPYTRNIADLNLDEPITVELNNLDYSTMTNEFRVQMDKFQDFALKATTFNFTRNKDNSIYMFKRDTLYTVSGNVRYFAQQGSNNQSGATPMMEAYFVDTDHNNLDKFLKPARNVFPTVYYKDFGQENFIEFKLSEVPQFKPPVFEVNPKKMVEPLVTYGNSSSFRLLEDAGISEDGAQLVGCEVSWDQNGPLRGKLAQFRFRLDGTVYQIIFRDNGSNPASVPGLYKFTIPYVNKPIGLKLPEKAEKKLPSITQ